MKHTGKAIQQELLVQTLQMPNKTVSLNSIFAEGITVVKLMRRFGCPLTRYEASEFSEYQETFAALDVRLIGIGFDKAGTKSFLSGGFWKGELYLDPERVLYKVFNLQRLSKLQAIQNFLDAKTRKSIVKRLY
ncbi:hypothetical protein DSO57_1001344 [Entomophthora muscae]|uniref:Uncharacterized protein n=1 Tax=Entomophthora muscae TaxID=34485 RepID=A0ACC2SXZ9_9FUNG|nr:hypothetical protein DSO57_1001344 [Entomophthora muscae]